MALPPAVPARLVAPDASAWSSTSTAAASPTSSGCRCTTRCRSASTSGSVGGVLPTEWLQEHLCGDPCLRDERPALVRRLLHHRLRRALPDRADHRRRAVGAQARGVAAAGCAATSPSTSAPSSVYIVYPMAPPWMASEEGYIDEALPGSPAAAGATSGWAGSTWSSRASATRSPRCPRCTPASRSWSRCTASGGCARRCGGCSCSTRSRCPSALVYYAEHYVVDILAGAVLAGAGDGRRAGCGSGGDRDSGRSTTSPGECRRPHRGRRCRCVLGRWARLSPQ